MFGVVHDGGRDRVGFIGIYEKRIGRERNGRLPHGSLGAGGEHIAEHAVVRVRPADGLDAVFILRVRIQAGILKVILIFPGVRIIVLGVGRADHAAQGIVAAAVGEVVVAVNLIARGADPAGGPGEQDALVGGPVGVRAEICGQTGRACNLVHQIGYHREGLRARVSELEDFPVVAVAVTRRLLGHPVHRAREAVSREACHHVSVAGLHAAHDSHGNSGAAAARLEVDAGRDGLGAAVFVGKLQSLPDVAGRAVAHAREVAAVDAHAVVARCGMGIGSRVAQGALQDVILDGRQSRVVLRDFVIVLHRKGFYAGAVRDGDVHGLLFVDDGTALGDRHIRVVDVDVAGDGIERHRVLPAHGPVFHRLSHLGVPLEFQGGGGRHLHLCLIFFSLETENIDLLLKGNECAGGEGGRDHVAVAGAGERAVNRFAVADVAVPAVKVFKVAEVWGRRQHGQDFGIGILQIMLSGVLNQHGVGVGVRSREGMLTIGVVVVRDGAVHRVVGGGGIDFHEVISEAGDVGDDGFPSVAVKVGGDGPVFQKGGTRGCGIELFTEGKAAVGLLVQSAVQINIFLGAGAVLLDQREIRGQTWQEQIAAAQVDVPGGALGEGAGFIVKVVSCEVTGIGIAFRVNIVQGLPGDDQLVFPVPVRVAQRHRGAGDPVPVVAELQFGALLKIGSGFVSMEHDGLAGAIRICN
ncbi:hypothetical protein SDC9_42743 [bioreactor metagenome]|uniref:Uncharacterized protein n=1 Tax=bioreactor metagenome TaxID=1076179 RepID=A0A644VYQ7_9ZZZZ